MKKKKIRCIGVALAGLLGFYSHTATAAVISVDADPGVAGIQATRTVAPGTAFTVDVVLDTTGDLFPTIFDTTILEVSFNDSGAVLSLGPTGPLAGALTGALFTLDIFGGFVPTAPGAPLATGASIPAAGFASGSGQVGLFNAAPFFSVGPGIVTTIFSLDFTAGAAAGTSALNASNTAGPELAFVGGPVPAGLAPATITVQSAVAVPEPGTLLLFGAGLFGMALMIRRRRA